MDVRVLELADYAALAWFVVGRSKRTYELVFAPTSLLLAMHARRTLLEFESPRIRLLLTGWLRTAILVYATLRAELPWLWAVAAILSVVGNVTSAVEATFVRRSPAREWREDDLPRAILFRRRSLLLVCAALPLWIYSWRGLFSDPVPWPEVLMPLSAYIVLFWPNRRGVRCPAHMLPACVTHLWRRGKRGSSLSISGHRAWTLRVTKRYGRAAGPQLDLELQQADEGDRYVEGMRACAKHLGLTIEEPSTNRSRLSVQFGSDLDCARIHLSAFLEKSFHVTEDSVVFYRFRRMPLVEGNVSTT